MSQQDEFLPDFKLSSSHAKFITSDGFHLFMGKNSTPLRGKKTLSTGRKDTPLQAKILTSNQVENHQLSRVLRGWKNSSTLCSSFIISFHTAHSEFSIGCRMTHLLFTEIYTQQHVVALQASLVSELSPSSSSPLSPSSLSSSLSASSSSSLSLSLAMSSKFVISTKYPRL
jgi:hypothetical protein